MREARREGHYAPEVDHFRPWILPRSLDQFRRVATRKHRPKRMVSFFPFSRDITRGHAGGDKSV